MEKKNSAVELWRFVFTIAIAIGHLNSIIWEKKNVNLLFTGNKFIVFFMLLSGYFLMKHYQENKNKKEASIQALDYTKRKVKALYPTLLGGVILAFIVRNVINAVSVSNMFTSFMNSIWEFLGLAVFTGSSLTLWNEPLWYISALFVLSFILYYVLSKNEDLFRVLAIIFIIFAFGTVGFNSLGLSINIYGVSSSLLIFAATMVLGMLMYYLVKYFQDKKLSENWLMFLSIIHIFLAMFIIYFLIHGNNWSNSTYAIILFIFTTVLLINKDYIAVLYNDSMVLNTLGKLSLYIFAYHIVFIYLLAFFFPEMSYGPSIVFNILFSVSWAMIMLYVDEYCITPIFRREIIKEEAKKEEVKVKKTVTTKKKATKVKGTK